MPTIALHERSVYGFANPYELNGRVSTHPTRARGFSSMNVYAIVEGDEAVVVDCGFSAHQEALLRQLGAVLRDDVRVGIVLTRPGEFNGVCNLRPIAERFAATTVYSLYPRTPYWGDIRPDLRPYGTAVGDAALETVAEMRVRPGDTIDVGTRAIAVVPAPMQLLPTFWLYDAATATLFSGELFGWVTRATPDGPWEVEEGADDAIDADAVAAYLSGSRFWWLPAARTEELRRDLARLFNGRTIETVAPAWGALLRGRAVVERHFDLLDRVLAEAPARPSVGLDAGRWRYRG